MHYILIAVIFWQGGFPAWILKANGSIVVRSMDPGENSSTHVVRSMDPGENSSTHVVRSMIQVRTVALML